MKKKSFLPPPLKCSLSHYSPNFLFSHLFVRLQRVVKSKSILASLTVNRTEASVTSVAWIELSLHGRQVQTEYQLSRLRSFMVFFRLSRGLQIQTHRKMGGIHEAGS
jgi:hypothetical protein